MAVLGYLLKLQRDLGLAFAAHFLRDFSINMFFVWYSIDGAVGFLKKVDQQPDFFTGSLNVDSLFSNIPWEETIEVCTNELFEDLSKSGFKELLSLTIKDLNFYFWQDTLQTNRWLLGVDFWVGLLSWVSYNFQLRGTIWSFFTLGIIDPILNTREVIQYFGTFSRIYYLVSKTSNFLQF